MHKTQRFFLRIFKEELVHVKREERRQQWWQRILRIINFSALLGIIAKIYILTAVLLFVFDWLFTELKKSLKKLRT